ncbi:hypothetical protein Ciccas_002457 [Cichlidogyrus casuarinus]|uniref:Uncharacterized protein n=1 Tax=Cichlidogyrus casuarinus TaxID=1844966 RepID=A0ABD2QJE8_9PLAT
MSNFIIRTDINITIVAMIKTNNTAGAKSTHTVCNIVSNTTAENSTINAGNKIPSLSFFLGSFDWDEKQKGLILSGFYWGYGLLQGFTVPTCNALIGRWIPKYERSRCLTIFFSGNYIGMMVTQFLAGFISQPYQIDSVYYSNWPHVFYLFGTFGCIVAIIATEVLLGKKEDLATHNPMKKSVPWKSMLTSVPFWAIVSAHVTCNWIFYTSINYLPTYMSQVLGFDVKTVGLLTAIPFLVQWPTSLLISVASDVMLKRGHLTTSQVRKINTCLGTHIFLLTP